MTAALAIGDQGFDVHLVEREDTLGGNLNRVRLLLEGDPEEMVDDLIRRVNEHPRVQAHLGREVEAITGYVGNFTTRLSGGESLDHGVVVVATGGTPHEPASYMYGEDPRVVTQLEFEAQLAEAEDVPASAVFIQCVGSRDEEHPWCSRICCGASVKEALHLKGMDPDAQVYVLYRDIRTYGLKEDAYREAAEKGVIFVRYEPDDPPSLEREGDDLVVRVKDEVLGGSFAIATERVVLATAVLPREDNGTFGKMLKVPLTKDGFFLEAHVKLRPLDFATEGVFVCGMAHWPKTVDETAGQAYGVAARAATILSLSKLETEGIVSSPDPELCRGCGRCIGVCEYGAPELVETSPGIWVSQVNEVLCKGCGKCAVACPTKAISMRHFTDDQIDAMLEALLRGVS
jgi:heterodisulfide reductase subunit A